MHWTTTRFTIDLNEPRVMGVLNLTPDSFSDGGQLQATGAALKQAEAFIRQGACLLDLGAESSRPGAAPVPAKEEWSRLRPTLTALLGLGVPISVDTCKPEVMQRALELGVDVINDIQALRAPGAVELLRRFPRAGVCLMHMRGEPLRMQQMTHYQDAGYEVAQFLSERAQAVRAEGVDARRIVLDPGYGFAKTAPQSLAVQRSASLQALGYPLLAGWSRKSILGWITGAVVAERLGSSVAAALVAAQAGARVIRVHDVGATVQALRTWAAMQGDPWPRMPRSELGQGSQQ
jgi:dihydropteroate synthase